MVKERRKSKYDNLAKEVKMRIVREESEYDFSDRRSLYVQSLNRLETAWLKREANIRLQHLYKMALIRTLQIV